MKLNARGVRTWIAGWAGAALVVTGLTAGVGAANADPVDPAVDKVEQSVRESVSDDGRAAFWVRFGDRPDLASLAAIPDWSQRGQAVHEALASTAEASQASARAGLDNAGATYRTFYATNAIYVRDGNADVVSSLASLPEVEGIYAPRSYDPPEPAPAEPQFIPSAVEWGVENINAPQVWADFGVTGEDIVVASIDTGVQWDHPALIEQYRGNNGDGTFTHDYSWYDATGLGEPEPWDWDGHGTHVTGTMVGDDGGDNQIGVAPGAQWISAAVSFSDESLISSGEWMLAPTDLGGDNPDPDLRPHIVNNSWGTQVPSNDPFMVDVSEAWAAAGIVGIWANGNSGPGCATSGSPGSLVINYSVGSYDINNNISSFSGRGPGEDDGIKPNISAPGQNVRSSFPGNNYGAISGTSMASPHVAGAVALLWSAGINLVGDTDLTYELLNETAIDTEDLQCGGTAENNNVYGEGRLDAYALLLAAPLGPVGTVTGTVTDAETSEPIAGAQVQFVGEELSRTIRTAADGSYTARLSAGSYDVTVSRFGYVTDTDSVTVEEDQTVVHDVALAPAPSGIVTGTVTDGSGQGWPLYARVSVGTDAATFTDPETGEYSLALPVGTHTLTATAQLPGYLVEQRTVTITDGGSTVEDFALQVDAVACVAPGYTINVEGVIETFDTEELPPGWAIEDLNGSGGVWTIGDPWGQPNFTGGDGLFAAVNSDFYGPETFMDTVLVSPSADLSAVTDPTVGFKYDLINISAWAAVEYSLDGGTSWEVAWETTSSIPGPAEAIVPLPEAAGEPDVQVRFRYVNDVWDWWWQVDDVFVGNRTCDPTGGGLVVGYVVDDRAGDPIINARVVSVDNPSDVGITRATPADDNLDDGFYWLYSALEGTNPFEASARNYGTDLQDVTVVPGDVARADFVLTSAAIEVDPTSIETTVVLGESDSGEFTVTNVGTATAELTFAEVAGDFVILRADGSTVTRHQVLGAPGAPTVSVPVEASAAATRPADLGTSAVPPRTAEEPWTDLTPTPTTIMDNRMVQLDGSWYSIGGSPDWGSPTDAVWRYDAAALEWETLESLPVPVQQPAAAVVSGQIVVAGGWLEGGNPSPHTWIYDAAADAWTEGADLPVPVASPGQAVADGLLYVIGGCTTANCEPMSDAVSVYDVDADSWDSSTPYPEAAAFPSCGGLDGLVLCTGGITPFEDLSSAALLDPATGVWTDLPDAPVTNWASAHAVANRMLVISGGIQNGDVTNATYGYSLDDEAWVDLPSSNTVAFRSGGACGFARSGGLDANFSPISAAEELPGFDICDESGADVPWLELDTTEAVLPPGESVTVVVTTDSAFVSQPGTYTAGVRINGNVPERPDPVDVTMNVLPPTTWGKIDGTGSTQDCEGVSTPRAGITVTAVPTREDLDFGWVLVTDADGYYARWINDQVGELEMTAVFSGHFPQTAYAIPVRGQTVTTDFDLRHVDCGEEPGPLPPTVIRYPGVNRYHTAALVAQRFAPGVDTVFVATGRNFPDALAASARAGSLGGPVLLTRTDHLPDVTKVELNRLQPANVIIVGDNLSIDDATEVKIRNAVPGATVTRYAGAHRYETAALIAADIESSDVVYVATGLNYPDALAGAARAGALDAPVLLVRPDLIPNATAQQLARLAPDRIVLLGSNVTVSDDVETALGAYGTVERVFGDDRYGTAAAIAQDWETAPDVYLATGLDYPDALTGSALAAHTNSPVLLVQTENIPHPTWDELERLDPARAHVLGDEDAIGQAVVDRLLTLQ